MYQNHILIDINNFQLLMRVAFDQRNNALGAVSKSYAGTLACLVSKFMDDESSSGILRACLAGEALV